MRAARRLEPEGEEWDHEFSKKDESIQERSSGMCHVVRNASGCHGYASSGDGGHNEPAAVRSLGLLAADAWLLFAPGDFYFLLHIFGEKVRAGHSATRLRCFSAMPTRVSQSCV